MTSWLQALIFIIAWVNLAHIHCVYFVFHFFTFAKWQVKLRTKILQPNQIIRLSVSLTKSIHSSKPITTSLQDVVVSSLMQDHSMIIIMPITSMVLTLNRLQHSSIISMSYAEKPMRLALVSILLIRLIRINYPHDFNAAVERLLSYSKYDNPAITNGKLNVELIVNYFNHLCLMDDIYASLD